MSGQILLGGYGCFIFGVTVGWALKTRFVLRDLEKHIAVAKQALAKVQKEIADGEDS